MFILGLDTATFTSIAALVDGEGRVLAEGTLDTSGRGDDLLVLVDEVCARAGLAPRQLTAVAVGAGPGSFTGLRIGMATAKGIAFAAGCPLWLVSALGAMAAELAAEIAGTPSARPMPTLFVPVLDARRGEVFAGFYNDAAGALAPAAAEQVLAPEALAGAIAAAQAQRGASATDAVVCSGDALEVFGEALASLAPQWRAVARTPAGRWVARLALAGPREDALRGGRPAYLRPAEAEIMYPDGVPGALRSLVLPPSLAQPEVEKP